MLTHITKQLFIYFGDATDGIYKQLHCNPTQAKLVDAEPFKSVVQKIDVPRLSALNQTHGVEGVCISTEDISFSIEGDYLITNQKRVGLGVLTADCVPIVLHDIKNNVVGIAHAGWRGTLAGIVPQMITHMSSLWNTAPADAKLFIGPSAKGCCYQVQQDFFQNLNYTYYETMMQRNGNWYFDMLKLLELQMKNSGIDAKQINTDFNFCTICDKRFFSHRRQAENAGRQITIARLY